MSKTTQMALSSGRGLWLKPWTLVPANSLDQGAKEMFGQSDLIPHRGYEGFSHTHIHYSSSGAGGKSALAGPLQSS